MLVGATLIGMLVLAACGSSTSTTTTGSDEGPEANSAASTAAPAPSDATATEPLKVALLATQKFGDKGPMDDMKAALERAQADFGVEVKFVESPDAANYESDLAALSDAGTDLIITSFAPIAEPLAAVAPKYPDVKFSHIFGSGVPADTQNVRSIGFDFYKGTYLAGIAAATMSQTDSIGFIAGMNIPVMNVDYNAYVAGAQSVKPDIETKIAYATSFEDPAAGKELALGMYGSGIDVIATDAAATGLGVIDAAKQKDKLVIGDSADQSSLAPANYLTSTILRFGNVAYLQVKDLVDGTWKPGETMAGLEDDVVGLSGFDSFAANGPAELTSKIPDLEAAIETARQGIIDGTIQVPKNETAG